MFDLIPGDNVFEIANLNLAIKSPIIGLSLELLCSVNPFEQSESRHESPMQVTDYATAHGRFANIGDQPIQCLNLGQVINVKSRRPGKVFNVIKPILAQRLFNGSDM